MTEAHTPMFESLVNTEGIQTNTSCQSKRKWFESLVNTEGIQTWHLLSLHEVKFESLVNTEGIQTEDNWCGKVH